MTARMSPVNTKIWCAMRECPIPTLLQTYEAMAFGVSRWRCKVMPMLDMQNASASVLRTLLYGLGTAEVHTCREGELHYNITMNMTGPMAVVRAFAARPQTRHGVWRMC